MSVLDRFGLSNYESRALEVLLRSKCTAKELIKLTKIPPGRVYTILKSLLKKKLVSESSTRPKCYFVEDPNVSLGKLIESKQLETNSIISEARRLAIETSIINKKSSPFFQFGTTKEDNRTIQLRSFQEAKKEVCQIINIYHKPLSNRENKTRWEKEIKNATERGVIFRSIYPLKLKLPPILKNLPSTRFVVRRKDLDFIRCDLIDNKKVLLKLVHEDAINFGGIIFLEDENFARNLKCIFDQFWEESTTSKN